MSEFYENLSLPWRCEDSRKWELVKWFDKLLAETNYTEAQLRDVIKSHSREIATDRRDELTDSDADRVIDRLSTLYLLHLEQKQAEAEKEKEKQQSGKTKKAKAK